MIGVLESSAIPKPSSPIRMLIAAGWLQCIVCFACFEVMNPIVIQVFWSKYFLRFAALLVNMPKCKPSVMPEKAREPAALMIEVRSRHSENVGYAEGVLWITVRSRS